MAEKNTNEFEIALNGIDAVTKTKSGQEEFIHINSYKEVDGKEVWYKRTSCLAHTKAFTLQTLEIEQKMLAKAGIIVTFKEGNNKKEPEEFSTIDLGALFA